MIEPWAANYVGIPYVPHGQDSTGCDCWGLVVMVLQREFGVNLPSATYDLKDFAGLADQIRGTYRDENTLPLDKVQPGDLLFFRQAGHVSHCGVAVGDGMMLHARDDQAVVMEPYRSGLWARRLHGAFRVTE